MLKLQADPTIEKIDYRPALDFFEAMRHTRYPFLLESICGGKELARYSFVGADPFLLLKSKGVSISILRNTEDTDNGNCRVVTGNPFDILEDAWKRYRMPDTFPLPLVGGVVGYFGYELGRFLEVLPGRTRDDQMLPDCCLGFYDTLIAVDNLAREAFFVSTGYPKRGKDAQERIKLRRHWLEERVSRIPPPQERSVDIHGNGHSGQLRSNFSKSSYLQAIAAAKEYIAAGDIYQVNLSQRFEKTIRAPAWNIYSKLRQVNPAPFAAYLDFHQARLLSASPERFLCLRGRQVVTRPIKGTRPRASHPHEDQRLAEALLESEKDNAEHVMIVDLERNDLGKVCETGSVSVPELATLESYATVHHLVSTVAGTLREDSSPVSLIRACFPGGSITGAPKIRAMEIIDEIEPTTRGAYTGSVGYLSFSGDLDLSIAIRTIIEKDSNFFFQVGGGIVADSEPEAEYEETLDKAEGLIKALS